jgi:hypothetical protein
MSKGERLIDDYFRKNKINFETQKSFKKCKYKNVLRFDFYIKEKDLLIEYDGIGHFKPVPLFGGDKYFKYKKNNDIIKNTFCVKHKQCLLRIPYTDIQNIDEILDEYLEKDGYEYIEYSSIDPYKNHNIKTFENT